MLIGATDSKNIYANDTGAKTHDYSISLTGHRPDKLWGYNLSNYHYKLLFNKLLRIIDNELNNHAIVNCHSGMALGADTVWAYAILSRKKKYPNRVNFIVDIPFNNQSSKWSIDDQHRYSELMSKADDRNIYSDNYTNYCMMKRNRGLVDNADLLIAIYDTGHGGTFNTIKYARSKNKRIITINPANIG